MNLQQLMASAGEAVQAAEIAGEVVVDLEADLTTIKSGHPATIVTPPVGGSIEGVAGKFEVTVTFTPNAESAT